MTYTNIKNLPEDGNYFSECGYSQKYPWVEIRRTAKTVTLMKVNVKRDLEWKPEMIPGGFVAHCTNQGKQTWLFDGFDENMTKTIRMTQRGWTYKGTRFLEDQAVELYDYNF